MFMQQLILFFFFQVEVGIRDRDVTGVQTCALPICRLLPACRRDGSAAVAVDTGSGARHETGSAICGPDFTAVFLTGRARKARSFDQRALLARTVFFRTA